MRIRECVTDAKTGEVTEQWIDVPDVMTLEQGMAFTAAEARKEATGNTLVIQAEQAIVNLRAYRDLASPTNAQTVAAVKLLCRVCIGLIRLYLRRFDGTD